MYSLMFNNDANKYAYAGAAERLTHTQLRVLLVLTDRGIGSCFRCWPSTCYS
jgi:hypothetical protein